MRSIHNTQRPAPNFLIRLALPLILIIIAGFAWRPLGGGDDFWAHASIGRWILEHGRMPRQTLFLWSESIPWIAHAWGTGVLFAMLMRLGGESGGPVLTQIVNILFSMAPFVLLWRYWRKNAPFNSLIPPLFVLAIWVGSARFHPRPELFTALFMTLLLLFLAQWPHQKQLPKGQIAGILLMFAIWPNMHGAVAIGVVLIWATALCELWQSRGDLRLMVLAAFCTLLIFVCNPRGFEYYQVLLPVASETFKKIDEWKPFWAWPALDPALVVGEVALWIAGILMWASNPSRRLSQLVWMIIMMAAFLSARRQLWLTALTTLAVLVTNSQRLQSDELFRGWRRLTKGNTTEDIPAPMRLIARIGVLIILICAAVQAIPKDRKEWHATNPKLPVRLAAFILDKAPQGRLFNDYENSAYLEWAFHDKRKLYIDLNNAYPDTLMNEYFEVMASNRDRVKMAKLTKRRAQILAQRKIEVAAIRPYTDKEGLSIVGKYLDKTPGWKRIYKQQDGTVWALQ
jgi:hypothetical protein